MDNHYHLLLWDPHAEISRAMAYINGPYTAYINLRHERDGALLRGRFFSHPSDDARYALCVLRYIHLNPVSAGMVEMPGAYHWSSHRLYMQPSLPGIVPTHHMLNILAEIGVGQKQIDLWTRDPLSSFVYDERVARKQLSAPQRKEETKLGMCSLKPVDACIPTGFQPAVKRRTSCREIVEVIAQHYGVSAHAIRQPPKGYKNPATNARYLAAYACFAKACASYDELATMFGVARNTVGVFIIRGKRLSARNRATDAVVTSLDNPRRG